MTAHTPGPWELYGSKMDSLYKSSEIHGPPDTSPRYESIAIIPHDDITDGDWEVIKANVALIKASPDLLAACKVAEKFMLSISYNPVMSVQNAIAKAEGRGP